MTKLYINSTDPELAKRMKPEVYKKILDKRTDLTIQVAEALKDQEAITLEIGCGHGHFLTSYGQAFPEESCIGIDVNKGRIYKAQRKVDRAKLKNVKFFDCDSLEFLALLPKHIKISKTWILYPDPWPKKRHFKNRIVQAEFLTRLAAVNSEAGQLFLRSDYEPYLDWSKELIAASSQWKLQSNFEWPELAVTVFQELTENKHFSLAATLNPTK